MEYEDFLLMMSQLSSQKKARIVVQGSVYFIETTSKKNKWLISTQLFEGSNSLPSTVNQCVSSCGTLRWDFGGAYLKLDRDESNLYLMQEIETDAKYVPFRYLMSDFIDIAEEWKEILDDFSQRDHTSTRISNHY